MKPCVQMTTLLQIQSQSYRITSALYEIKGNKPKYGQRFVGCAGATEERL
jgi:hypothetical protein